MDTTTTEKEAYGIYEMNDGTEIRISSNIDQMIAFEEMQPLTIGQAHEAASQLRLPIQSIIAAILCGMRAYCDEIGEDELPEPEDVKKIVSALGTPVATSVAHGFLIAGYIGGDGLENVQKQEQKAKKPPAKPRKKST